MLGLLRKSVPSRLSSFGGALLSLLSPSRGEPTTFQRCLAVHMHFAERSGALH